MAEPVRDLPDPLDEQTSTSESADDLVAQLADEAIDQLIADADRGDSPKPPEPPVAWAAAPEPEPVAPPSGNPLQAQLDTLFSQLGDEPVATDSPAPSTASENPVLEPSPTDPPQDVVVPPVEASALEAPPVEAPAVEATQERTLEPDVTPAMQSDVRALLDDAVHQAPSSGAPAFIVRPLEWINAPFARLSDNTRDTLGQVAVVTLINALAVILYVVLFRRG